MSELNQLIQRICCDIANVKKQASSDLEENKRHSSTPAMKTQGCPTSRKKQVSLLGLRVPGQPQALFLTCIVLGRSMSDLPTVQTGQ